MGAEWGPRVGERDTLRVPPTRDPCLPPDPGTVGAGANVRARCQLVPHTRPGRAAPRSDTAHECRTPRPITGDLARDQVALVAEYPTCPNY
jgi:hypothetical protein